MNYIEKILLYPSETGGYNFTGVNLHAANVLYRRYVTLRTVWSNPSLYFINYKYFKYNVDMRNIFI